MEIARVLPAPQELMRSSWTIADVAASALVFKLFDAGESPEDRGFERSSNVRKRPVEFGAIGYSDSDEVMILDWRICSRARLSRDARFDGKFFIAVRGSRVYCRSICPAPTAKEENCRYYPTAAAAAEAGYRPCLRCRPECSPGTPAWLGTPSTVSRALRLIDESGLEDGGVELLAERLGVGSRHLRRLFLQHLGATPTAVAQTRRLQFAKKMIDETALPMKELALASGFGCVRRFNAAIRKAYHRTPTQIRHLARRDAGRLEDQYEFHLRFRPPYDWQGTLAFLAARVTQGVEVVENDCYRRAISVEGNHGYIEVSIDEAHHSLIARVQFESPRPLFSISERIRAMFDLNADWASIMEGLGGDPALADGLRSSPGLRVPGCWDPFELAVRAILGQQITVKAATTLAGRIAAEFGQPYAGPAGITRIFPSPQVLAEANLASVGMPRARAETIRRLARAVCDKKISFEHICDCDTFLSQLCEIPGIGQWTAQYIAMRALREPDAFPSGDVALLRALGLSNTQELQQRAEAWRPWRAYAVMCLWQETAQSKVKA
ncbi:MAG TPA: AlkA N-terminal domain-containing protein [Terriglobales bacterium]